MSWAGLAHLGEMVFIPRSYEIFYLTSTKEFVMSLEKGFSITSQKIFVGLQDMSWRRLQHVFSVTILCLPRRLEDVLKTCLEDVLKTCLEDVLKTYLEDVFKTSWRQTKCLLGISVSNKSKCVYLWSNKSIFNKSISDKSKANPKCID